MTATLPPPETPSPAVPSVFQRATGMARWALDKLPGGRFTRSVAVLAGGTALGQAITIAAAPLLTRLYTPEDFGVFGVYTSLLGIFAVVASLRYEFAIPLPERDADAAALVVLSLAIIPVTALGLGLVVWLLRDHLIAWTQTPGLAPYLWLLPIGVALRGTYSVFNYWAVRRKAFPRIAQTKFTQGVALALLQIVMFPLGAIGLLIGWVAGSAAGTGTLVLLTRRHDAIAFRGLMSTDLAAIASRYRRFPQFSTAAGMVNAAGLVSPVLLLSAFYGPFVAGQFALVQRVLAMPMSLIGTAVSQVYFGEGAGALHRSSNALRSLFLRTSLRLAAIAVVPTLLLLVGGAWFFTAVFGSEWTLAGRFAQALAVMLAFQMVASPLSQTFNILERQSWQLAWDVFRLVLVVLAFAGAWSWTWPPEWAVAGYAAAMIAAYAVLWSVQLVGIAWSASLDSMEKSR